MAKNFWEDKKKLSYVKIGVFFLVGVALLLTTLILVKDVTFFRPSRQIKVFFNFAEGLKRASPVRFCGVDVGEVRQVRVVESADGPRVQVKANVEKGVKIPRGSYIFINSLSLFGEKYIEITPPDQFSGYLEEGEVIEGISPVPLFQIFAGFTKTMDELKSFVEEGQIKETLEKTAKNLEDITLEAKELITDIKEKEGTLGRFLYDDSLYQKTEEFISDLKEHPWKLFHKPRGK